MMGAVCRLAVLATAVMVCAAGAAAAGQAGAERAGAVPAAIRGVVTDEASGAVGGVQIALVNPAGNTVQIATTDQSGEFTLPGVGAGDYVVTATNELFQPLRTRVQVKAGTNPEPLTMVLHVAGFVESLVVTGSRIETRRQEIPQKIEVIDRQAIERSVATDLTDVLKKNSGVDVIQYNGVLSGIGIRGFRPEFSGINKRSLLLIDGRPAGATNLATIQLENIERIEVLKGPASALYGSSAMGGVVNVITRKSRGKLAGDARLDYGSFGTSDLSGKVGGSIGRRVDFDASGTAFDQREDYRMGNGLVRDSTAYKTYDGGLRLGTDIGGLWRLDGRVNVYAGRDIMLPGDIFNGTNGQGSKDIDRRTGDVRLQGQIADHVVSTTVYRSKEWANNIRVTSTNVLDQGFLPFLTSESEIHWTGVQLQDAWAWTKSNHVVLGLDYELVESANRSFARTGERASPFSADNDKRTVGAYFENTSRLNDGRTIITTGGRVDVIRVGTYETEFKTGFVPSRTNFTIFNPSIGLKQEIAPGLRLHGMAGKAFVPADAGSLTGFTETTVGGRQQITQGNPGLRPERSASFDAGIEATLTRTHVDVTYFQTKVIDRVVSNIVISNPPPPAPVIVTYQNSLGSRIKGMDLDFSHRLTANFGVSSNVTHYFTRREQLTATTDRNILNVASNTVRASIDVDVGRFSGRISGRYVQGRQDNDFNTAGTPIIDYPDFALADVTASYRLQNNHSVLLSINNLLDNSYFEKKGYDLAGRAVSVKYRFNLAR